MFLLVWLLCLFSLEALSSLPGAFLQAGQVFRIVLLGSRLIHISSQVRQGVFSKCGRTSIKCRDFFLYYCIYPETPCSWHLSCLLRVIKTGCETRLLALSTLFKMNWFLSNVPFCHCNKSFHKDHPCYICIVSFSEEHTTHCIFDAKYLSKSWKTNEGQLVYPLGNRTQKCCSARVCEGFRQSFIGLP